MNYVAIYGIIYNCPFGRRLTTCPFYGLDHKSFEDKFNSFEELTIAEKDAIVAHHSKCAGERTLKKVSF